MATTLLKKREEIVRFPLFFKKHSSIVLWAATAENITLRSVPNRTFFSLNNNFKRPSLTRRATHKIVYHNELPRPFSSSVPKIEGSSPGLFLNNLETALRDHQVDQAWDAFNSYRALCGFPDYTLLRRLITQLSYSSDPGQLRKASNLVFSMPNDKLNLLDPDSLATLCLALARARMPEPSSKLLRSMLGKLFLPRTSLLSSIFLHMVKSEVGSCLVSNLLVEICDTFLCLKPQQSNCAKLLKPDTVIFNLVLNSCVQYGFSIKGQQIIELMARVGVIADARSIVLIAQIHEMNGQRDEVKKFKGHVDGVCFSFASHYRQFYDSLLSLHFMFNDVDAAAGLALDLCRFPKSHPAQNVQMDLHRPCFVPIGSEYLRAGLKLVIAPEVLQRDSVLDMESKQELIVFKNGKLLLTNRALAKLLSLYRSCGRVTELSKLIIGIQKESYMMPEANLSSKVIDACICLGWLATAHDILDDIEAEGASVCYSTYKSLLTGYCKENMLKEANVLLKQMKKVGLAFNMSNEMVISRLSISDLEIVVESCSSVNMPTAEEKSDLARCLLWELKEEQRKTPPVVYEYNSSIYFFCKAKMIEDALRTYRRMNEGKIQPTVQTFANMVYGYSSWKMYRELTILWGDIKRNIDRGNFVVNRDLFELFLLNFLHGGYFERVMEVIDYMKEHGMYTDKGFYRNQFLKLHKDLYRNLKASKVRNEAQSKRLEFVEALRKWVSTE